MLQTIIAMMPKAGGGGANPVFSDLFNGSSFDTTNRWDPPTAYGLATTALTRRKLQMTIPYSPSVYSGNGLLSKSSLLLDMTDRHVDVWIGQWPTGTNPWSEGSGIQIYDRANSNNYAQIWHEQASLYWQAANNSVVTVAGNSGGSFAPSQQRLRIQHQASTGYFFFYVWNYQANSGETGWQLISAIPSAPSWSPSDIRINFFGYEYHGTVWGSPYIYTRIESDIPCAIPSNLDYVAPLVTDVGVTPAALYSTRLANAAYSGSCFRLRNLATGAVADIGFTSDGFVDYEAARRLSVADGSALSLQVVRWYDQSGSGNYLEQTSPTTSSPTFDLASMSVNFNGSTNFMQSVGALDLSGTNGVTVFELGKPGSSQSGKMIYEHGAASDSTDNGFGSYLVNGADGTRVFQSDGTNINVDRQPWTPGSGMIFNPDFDRLVTAQFDRAQAAGADKTTISTNGSVTGATTETSGLTTGNFGSKTLNVGARNGASNFAYIGLKELAIFGTALSDSQRLAAETNIARYHNVY